MISVIVPVYNVERYLNRCVDSLLAQTYSDYEILLIDDGSTDSSGKICDGYAARDKRVKVYHQDNSGVSNARNKGLENAAGEWIAFCDSDDYVTPDYLKNLHDAAEGSEIDLVFNYAVVHCNGKADRENYPCRLIGLEDIADMFLYNELIWHTSTWSKLFRRSIIERLQLRYLEDVHLGEDAVFLYSYIFACRKIKTICSCDYHYIIYGGTSLTQRINTFDSELKGLEAISSLLEQFKSMYPADKRLEKIFAWLTASFKRRTLSAMYYDDIKRTRRLEYLKTTDFSDYISALQKDRLHGRIYSWLLKNAHYRTYDILRLTVKKISPWIIRQ